MKKLYFIVLALLISSLVYSQDKYNANLSPKLFGIEITAGPSFPYGDFGSKDAYNESAGFAKVGYKAGVNLTYHLIDIIDINLMGFFNSNGTNLSNLQNALSEKYGGAWTADSRTWNIYGGFLGFEFSYPIYRKLSVGFRAYSGMINSKAPELTIRNGNFYYKQDEKTASSFSYIISLDGKYHLTNNLFWIASVDFLGGSASFKDVKTTVSTGNTPVVTVQTFSQDMRTVIINTGLRIVF
jgi:hypothetical protein